MSKKCTLLGAKHISKSKCTNHVSPRTTFGSWHVEQVHAVVAQSTFPSQNVKSTICSDDFWKFGSDVVLRGFCTSSKVSKTRGFCSISKHNRRRGAFEHDPERGISRGRRSTRDMFTRVVRMSADFLRGIRSSGLPRWFLWPGITFSWQAQHFRQMEWKNRWTHWYEAVSSAVKFPFWK